MWEGDENASSYRKHGLILPLKVGFLSEKNRIEVIMTGTEVVIVYQRKPRVS